MVLISGALMVSPVFALATGAGLDTTGLDSTGLDSTADLAGSVVADWAPPPNCFRTSSI